MEEEALRRAIHQKDLGRVNDIVDVLLTGSTPTNFSYQDILDLLLPFTDEHFVILPIWTLDLSVVEASAVCMVKHWPIFSDVQLEDTDFLASVRVMLPLFIKGNPIGHARFMMYDNWDPLPLSTLQDEEDQWSSVISEFLPRELTQVILDYGVLERGQPSCTGAYACKIIDSIPASTRVFEHDVDKLSQIIQMVQDDSWCPGSCEQNPQMMRRLHSLRKFLCYSTGCTGDTISPNIDSVILPSTTQTGLECIIITLCRVISSWLAPWMIPFEECRTLCKDKTGRRCLAELLIRSQIPPEELILQPDATPRPMVSPRILGTASKVDVMPSSSAGSPSPDIGTISESESVLSVSPPLKPWYSVYDRPTLSIHSTLSDYKPRLLEYDGVVGYTIYMGCKWVNHPRNQEFLPNSTVLSIGGTAGCLFICPVYQHIGKCMWHFLVLGTPGYSLFRAGGKTGRDDQGRSIQVHFEEAPSGHQWRPPPMDPGQLEVFISGWSDPTFKQHKPLQLDTSGEMSEDLTTDQVTPIKESKKGWLRRSNRTPKPRKKMEPVVQVRSKVYVTVLVLVNGHILLYVYVGVETKWFNLVCFW